MQRALPFIVFVIVLGVSRIIGAQNAEVLANLQPFGALFFCGMALFGMKGLILPAVAWLITVPITSHLQGYPWSAQILVPVLGYLAMIGLAHFFQGKKPLAIFLGSLGSAVLFYLITNSLSWAFDPLYAKTASGYVQAMWSGLPAYLPTWTFFRNDLISQALFSGVFLFATNAVSTRFGKPAQVASSLSA